MIGLEIGQTSAHEYVQADTYLSRYQQIATVYIRKQR